MSANAAVPTSEAAAGRQAVVGFPGAVPPWRTRTVVASGVRLAVHEWGSEHDPAVVLFHGGGDFARTFDVLAPKLAAHGLRVIGWDQRGHGDSGHAHYYGWDADARDGCAVITSTTTRPVSVLGHSKGGMVATAIATSRPELVSHLANLDGFAQRPAHLVGPNDPMIESRIIEMRRWLRRRRSEGRSRRPGTLDELAARRHANNRRLSLDWLRYLASVGAQPGADGWRWKGDPAMSQLLHNPVRLHWPIRAMPELRLPVLAVLGLVHETLNMGSTVDHVSDYLPPHARLEAYDDSGHFVHIEHPDRVVDSFISLLG